jgi:hypothetical protein
MNKKEHQDKHKELHDALGELAADYTCHNRGALLSKTTVLELLEWSHNQTIEPTPPLCEEEDDIKETKAPHKIILN